MSESAAMTVRLSSEARAFIRNRIETGEASSEEDAIDQGIAALKSAGEERQRWIQEEVIEAQHEYIADTSTAIAVDELHRETDMVTESVKISPAEEAGFEVWLKETIGSPPRPAQGEPRLCNSA